MDGRENSIPPPLPQTQFAEGIKMMCNNFNLDLVNNVILTLSKGHNYVVNLRKFTCDNPNLDLV